MHDYNYYGYCECGTQQRAILMDFVLFDFLYKIYKIYLLVFLCLYMKNTNVHRSKNLITLAINYK